MCVCVSGCIFSLHIIVQHAHTSRGGVRRLFCSTRRLWCCTCDLFVPGSCAFIFFRTAILSSFVAESHRDRVRKQKKRQTIRYDKYYHREKKHTPKREQSRQTNMSAGRERTSGLGYNILIDNNLREASRAPRCVDGKAPGLVVVVAAFADNITTMTLADN